MRPDRGRTIARLLAAVRRVAGMPDYAAFLAHHRAHHPDAPAPSEAEFFREYVTARYGDAPTRCC